MFRVSKALLRSMWCSAKSTSTKQGNLFPLVTNLWASPFRPIGFVTSVDRSRNVTFRRVNSFQAQVPFHNWLAHPIIFTIPRMTHRNISRNSTCRITFFLSRLTSLSNTMTHDDWRKMVLSKQTQSNQNHVNECFRRHKCEGHRPNRRRWRMTPLPSTTSRRRLRRSLRWLLHRRQSRSPPWMTMNRFHEVSLVSLGLFCGNWRLDEDDDELIRSPLLEDILSNDTWQKDEILAAKLENFLTTVLLHCRVVFVHPVPLSLIVFF